MVENNMNEFRMLDPVKISLTGLDMFIKKHGVKENATLTDKLERLEALSKEISINENDKRDMKNILEKLNKIMTCDLCHKGINWDKKEGLYNFQPEINARHQTCHKDYELTN